MTTWEEWWAKQTPQYKGQRYSSHWRMAAAEAIAEAMAGFSGDEQELRALLREAYPFGERKRWPYKMWLIEQQDAIAKWRAARSQDAR